MTNDDVQFIDLRKMSSVDICGIFRVPPHKVANLERATHSNIENQNREFVGDTMLPRRAAGKRPSPAT